MSLSLIGLLSPGAAAQQSSAVSTNGELKTAAAESKKNVNEVQLNYSYESLSNNFGSWRETSLSFYRQLKPRQTFYASYRLTERLKQQDNEGTIGIYQPLSRKWSLVLEGSASPTHRILPKWSVFAQAERKFKKGWNAQAGYRRTVYNSAKVNLLNAGAEKYWGNYRAAYTLYVSNLVRSGNAASHRVQFNRYYGEQSSSFGVGFAAGRELESLGRSGGVLQTDVQSFSVSGRHWLSSKWGINYGLIAHRQGKLYTRRGINIGLRFRF